MDPGTAWWAKLERAAVHLGSLRQQVAAYRAADPYEVAPEPTGTPGLTAYRLHIRQRVPVEISTIVGDIVHNLRSALDSLAYEMALRHVGQPLNREQEKASAFPVCETPERFDKWFTTNKRDAMYGPDERRAFRIVQPFAIAEAAGDPAAYAGTYRWDDKRRLNELSNLDKHRRLAVLGWGHDIMFWPSDGQTQRQWTPGDRRFIDGAVLGYMIGNDPEVGDAVYFQFNLVIEDDPVVVSNDDPTFTGYDAVWMLEGWHRDVRLALWNVIQALSLETRL
jgi:hypothetical protein